MNIKTLIAILSLFLTLPSFANTSRNDSILRKLDDVLGRRDTYYVTRQFRIDSLKQVERTIPPADFSAKSKALHDIFLEYGSFQGDSAIVYAERQLESARQSGIPDNILCARTDLIFTYLSGGSFTDAVDVVNHTDLSQASNDAKALFYYTCIRLFSDLSNFSAADFSDKYARKSGEYCDSVMSVAKPESYEYQYAMAFSPKVGFKPSQRIAIFKKILDRNDVPIGTKAMIASILGDNYIQAGDEDEFLYYKALSAILDVQSAKRETISKLDLGRRMFEDGDVERAYRYVDLAKEDAEFYNARNRKYQIMTILPLIEKARYMNIDNRRQNLLVSTLIMIALSTILILMLIRFIRQRKKLRDTRSELMKRNDELNQKNAELNNLLAKLSESNKIKDEYIGYGFSIHAEYIRKIEALYNMVDHKLNLHQYDELRKALKHSDIRKEKESMHKEFDSTFLRLCPNFIEEYKKLFPADDLKNAESDGHSLTSEMRIFALIRLGISDIADIALFLNYSVNTVNTYKTKAKNRSHLANGDFESAIMRINLNN